MNELILEGRDTAEQWLSAPDTYNRFTIRWRNWYWSLLKGLSINDSSFSALRTLKIIGSQNCYELHVDSNLLQDVHVSNLPHIEVLHLQDSIQSLHIDQCPALYRLTLPQPQKMFLGHALNNGLGLVIDSIDADWHSKFTQLQSRQQEMVYLVQKSGFNEENRYFQQFQEAFDNRCYYAPTWMLEKLRALFCEQKPFQFNVTKGLYAFYAQSNIIDDVALWESRSYTSWDDFEDSGYDWHMSSKIEEQPTIQKPLPQTIIDAMVKMLEDRPEWGTCDVSGFLSHDNALSCIFSTIESNQFWTWIETMPQDFQDAARGPAESK